MGPILRRFKGILSSGIDIDIVIFPLLLFEPPGILLLKSLLELVFGLVVLTCLPGFAKLCLSFWLCFSDIWRQHNVSSLSVGRSPLEQRQRDIIDSIIRRLQ